MIDGFADRLDAGRRLAEALERYRGQEAIVLGLPRGGVVVGNALARKLELPLGALVVRKLGAPRNSELAIGAVSETGALWLDAQIIREVGASDAYVQKEIAEQGSEAARRRREYGGTVGLPGGRGATAIIVDDGMATGATARVAVDSARDLGASRIVLAVPVASTQAAGLLRPRVDEFIALSIPEPFLAVGFHYGRFDQVSDEEVVKNLSS